MLFSNSSYAGREREEGRKKEEMLTDDKPPINCR